MAEQPKLLRRPPPPKLPSKLPTPREKVGKAGRRFGQYLARAVKSTNDKNGKAVSDSYVGAQGQVKQTDVSFSHGHISQNPVQTQPKDTLLSVHQICQSQKQIQLKDPLQTQYLPGSIQPQSDHISFFPICFQHRHVCQLNQGSKYGQTQIQSVTTGFHDQRGGLTPSETSVPTAEEVEQKGDLVFKNNNSAHRPLRGNTANLIDQYEIIPICSSSQIPNQNKEKNVFFAQNPRRDFILTRSPSGPDYFSFCKNHKFSHGKHQKLQSTGPAHTSPPVFTLQSVDRGSSHRLPLKTTLKKPFVSLYNCEVLSNSLMTENRTLQTEVNTVILSDIALPADETRKSEQQKFLDANDAPDSSTVENDWKTRFRFMADRKDEEENLMFRSQVKVWHCFLKRKAALSLQAFMIPPADRDQSIQLTDLSLEKLKKEFCLNAECDEKAKPPNAGGPGADSRAL